MRRSAVIWHQILMMSVSFALAAAPPQSDEAELEKARAEAEAQLAKLSAKADKMSRKMLEDLDHRNPEKRITAAEFLGTREEPAAVPGLSRLLSDPVAEVRAAAARALWQIGPPAAASAEPALSRALAGDANGSVRISAAGALWALGTPPAKTIPSLRAVLTDEDPYARVRAANLLVRMGVRAGDLMPTYREAMASPSSSLREYTLRTVLDLDDTPRDFAPLMLTGVGDSEEAVRILAIVGVRVLADPTPEVVAALRAATKDRSQYVRSSAYEALAEIAPEAAGPDAGDVSRLLAGLRDRKADVRRSAAVGLGEIGASSAEAIEALVRALSDKSQEVREAAAESFGKIGEPARGAIPHLWERWNDRQEHWTVRHAAGRSLAALGEKVDWENES